ncbi:PREDICTED: uncharacterized protein LOC105557611 [Vollenhovia emeryi]|uniref:uncharacterized protein LOC105557611 n=1 Tax=Vollenhovia emeryi TaxID=411798 RepID=UPI0005F573A9|nr:PREDICTED: uncharacterized protein LOC105557611 [Vollenhovia emeryi]
MCNIYFKFWVNMHYYVDYKTGDFAPSNWRFLATKRLQMATHHDFILDTLNLRSLLRSRSIRHRRGKRAATERRERPRIAGIQRDPAESAQAARIKRNCRKPFDIRLRLEDLIQQEEKSNFQSICLQVMLDFVLNILEILEMEEHLSDLTQSEMLTILK